MRSEQTQKYNHTHTAAEHSGQTVGNAWIQCEQTQTHEHSKRNEQAQSKHGRETQNKLNANPTDELQQHINERNKHKHNKRNHANTNAVHSKHGPNNL